MNGSDHDEDDEGRDPCDRWQQDPARSIGDRKSRVILPAILRMSWPLVGR